MMRTRSPKERIGEEWTDGKIVTKLVLMEGYAEISVKERKFLGLRMEGIKVDESGVVSFMHPQFAEVTANVGPATALQLQGKESKQAVLEVLSALRDELVTRQKEEGDVSFSIRNLPYAMPTEQNYTVDVHLSWQSSIDTINRAITSLESKESNSS